MVSSVKDVKVSSIYFNLKPIEYELLAFKSLLHTVHYIFLN
jgi:hypothetical protein